MYYRREIDGLRALAVLPVIFFHAGFQTFSGGFVGVDVFFVISGYLITSIILAELAKGSFSIVNFYERRARRILPALFTVMLVCIPFVWLWLLPRDMKDFSQSLVAVSAFASNFLFWMETGYFGTAAELKPLLHTWSLAVEEQYYVLFPLFLMLTWRFGRRWLLISLVAIGLVSLAVAHWGSVSKPMAAFFLLPTRGWELLIGALIALHFFSGGERRPVANGNENGNWVAGELLSSLGLLLILYAVFVYDETVPFPSLYALVPTVGTALIILHATPQTLAGKVLGSKVLVAIGLISYSAYLWHQPLFAFARHRSLTEPGPVLLLVLSAAAIVLAYLSWRFVEQPFRNRNVIGRKPLFWFSVIGAGAFAVFGVAGHFSHGFGDRGSVGSNGLSFADIEHKRRVNFGLNQICDNSFTLSPACRTSDQPEVVLWGDSYAMHLATGIMASNPDVKLIQMTKSDCGPFFGVSPIQGKYNADWPQGCVAFTREVRDWLRGQKSVKYVAISSTFDQYIGEGRRLLVGDRAVDASPDLVFDRFMKTLEEIAALGMRPVVFSPPPNNGENIGRCLTKAMMFGAPIERCDFTTEEITPARQAVFAFLREVEKKYDVVWLDEAICAGGTCRTYVEDKFIYRDAGHLSREGAALVGERMNFYRRITGR